MKEKEIEYETAVLAQKKGFNWHCDGYYSVADRQLYSWLIQSIKTCIDYNRDYAYVAVSYMNNTYDIEFHNDDKDYCFSAPTQSHLNKWLRDVHNFQIEISPYHCLGKDKPYGLTIDWLYPSGHWSYIEYEGENNFEMWEDAMEKGLVESLKMLPDV